MGDVDYRAVEHELCRIPAVNAARIVATDGEPREVHIVACGDSQARQVARDVQSVARVTFGLELDNRSISVVQMGDAGGGSPPVGDAPAEDGDGVRNGAGDGVRNRVGDGVRDGAGAGERQPEPVRRSVLVTGDPRVDDVVGAPVAPGPATGSGAIGRTHIGTARNGHRGRESTRGGARVAVERVVPRVDGASSRVDVELRSGFGSSSAVGSALGTRAPSSLHRAAAAATLDALRQLDPATGRADVESAAVTRIGERQVAFVTLVVVLPPHDHEEVLAGATVVRHTGELDAVCRAVLDAINRRMPMLAAE